MNFEKIKALKSSKKSGSLRSTFPRFSLMGLLLIAILFGSCAEENANEKWVGTWTTAPQLVEPHNMPPEPGLSNNTIRQIVRVSIGGDKLRMRFSNEFSTSPVTMKTVTIAKAEGGSTIDESTIKTLTFNNQQEVTMNAGEAVISDPVAFPLKSRMDLTITISYGETSADVTGHPGSRTTSYILSGNHSEDQNFEEAVKTDHWYTINNIEVTAPKKAAAIAILGNSITDGRGSGTNKQNRWPDILSERLVENPQTENVAVLNQGIGGNCVLKQCLGPSAIDRFERDVLNQNGVKWLIILEGINDIGQTPDSAAAAKVAENLISAYDQMIEKAHEHGILVYGATILPFDKSFYHEDYRQMARNTVNDWIRNSGRFDAVIDFDQTMRNPEDTLTIKADLHDGDFLHPNEKGYVTMGESIDLKLFQ
ncbi:lysophospholipase L1-like esterase [Marinilabilia salmonicolor]|jgi:lysophospholipase L1-like esterase|uniref:SGNH/GDSL hydrolase family protein n=1 Tax=Marinilabilia salmonicolor TaxID=989 RepID=UPI000D06F5A8|nr:SGNH/GDSL hydrolase family protein [Marinilabilia salmonicolor]PRZ01058.1 lysophospholipase L1-like esterase [Marinilabilia salmonicolor]